MLITSLPRTNPIKAVLFDLDGTLIDSAPEIVAAANAVAKTHGQTSLDFTQYRAHAGQGVRNLMQTAWNLMSDDPSLDTYVKTAFDSYASQYLENTQLFPGVPETIADLEVKNIPWGVVTNKLTCFTQPLIEKFGWENKLKVLVCADTLPVKKPDPQPILFACKKLQVKPENTVYVGDSKVDAMAGVAAGTYNILAKYGYIPEISDISSWQFDAEINQVDEVLACLN